MLMSRRVTKFILSDSVFELISTTKKIQMSEIGNISRIPLVWEWYHITYFKNAIIGIVIEYAAWCFKTKIELSTLTSKLPINKTIN